MKAILFFVAFAFLIVAQAESVTPTGGSIVKNIEVNLEHKIGQLRAQIANFRKVNKAQRVALRAQQERSREKRKANRATLKELQPKIDALKVKLAKAEQKVAPFEQEWNSITNQLARLRSRRDTAVRRINARIREQKWIRASLAATLAALKALQAKGATHKAALLEMPIEEATSFLQVEEQEVDAEAVAESDMNEEEQEEVLQEVDTEEVEEEGEESEEETDAEEDVAEAEEAAEEAVELATAAEDEAEADENEEETSDLNQRFAEVMSQVATSTNVGNSLDDAIHEVQVLRETAQNEINKLKQDREDIVTRFVREIKLAKERLANLAPVAKAAIARRDNLKDRLKKARTKKFTLIAANKAYRANEDVIEKQVASLRLAVQGANKRFEKQEARLIAELAQVKKLEGTLDRVEAAHGAVKVVTKKPAPASWRAGKWSECSQACGKGLKKREVKCVSFTGKPAPGQCVGAPRPAAVKTCQIKPCPSHCQVTAFSAWSKCTAVCTGKPRAHGTRIRTRTVVKAAKFGGRKCPALTQEQPCVRHCTVKNGLPVPVPVKPVAKAAAKAKVVVAKAAAKVAAPKAQPKAKAGSIAALPKVVAAKAKVTAAKAKVAAAKAKAKVAEQKRKEQKEKHAAAQAKRVELAKKLAEAKKKQEQAKMQLAEAKKNAGKDAETRAKIAALKAAVQKAKKALEESKARAKAAQQKEAKLKEALKQARKKCNKAKAAAFQAKIGAAKAQKKAAAIALKKGQEKIAKQKEIKKQLAEAKKKKEEKLVKNKEKRERLQKKLALAKDDKERARLQAKLEKVNKKLADIKQKLAKTEKKLADIKQKLAATKAKQAERKAKLAKTEKKVAQAKAKAVAHAQVVQKRKEERKKAEAKKARF